MEQQDQPLFDWKKIKNYFSDRENIIELARTLFFYGLIYGGFLLLSFSFNITPESVKSTFQGYGVLLVPVMIAAQLLASLTPLPDTPFNAVAILFFSPLGAFTIIIIGMWAGTIINFYIARSLGRDLVKKKYPQTSKWIDRFTGKYWFETIAAGRVFTLVTFDLMAYAAGISSITFRKFAFASFFGLIPVALNATLLGLALTSGSVSKTILYTGFNASLALAIGFGGSYFRRKWEHRSN